MPRSKTRRDAAGNISSFTQRLRRFEAVLQPLGLWEAFAAMPRPGQEMFCKLKLPEPTILFDASVKLDRDQRALRRELEAGLRKASIKVNDVTMAARDVIAVATGAMLMVRFLQNTPPMCAEVTRFV